MAAVSRGDERQGEVSKPNLPNKLYAVGETIRHPLYGAGVVRAESKTNIEVEFEHGEIKKISKAWFQNELK